MIFVLYLKEKSLSLSYVKKNKISLYKDIKGR